MAEGLTTIESAKIVEGLHWATTRLFELLGRWAANADRPDVAVSLATASRHMGWHADDLASLAPDSESLKGVVSNNEFEQLNEVLDRLEMNRDSIDNLAVAHRVLLARIGSRCVAVEKMAAAHSDAALARVMGFMLVDLRRDRDEGETLLELLMRDSGIVARVGAAVVEAESMIVDAGGLPQVAKPV